MSTSEAAADAETGNVIAVVYIRGQQEPVTIRSLRPLSIVACDALAEADRLLSAGRGLALRPAAVASVHVTTS